ncbi:MAG: glycosyltransferase family 2 protein, partial [Planctomycetota bacterium]
MGNLLCSVIIANWNGKQYLQRCLTAISLQTYKNIEVILIDNSSTDDSVDFITRNFPDIRLIRNNENYGFAKANNIGIKISKGKYIATINN